MAPLVSTPITQTQMGMTDIVASIDESEQGINDDDEEGGRDGEEGCGDEEGLRGRVGLYDEFWQRDDRGQWTKELADAHVAFERGREWGMEWGVCVKQFFDFEAAWGFAEAGAAQVPKTGRPQEVGAWIVRGRKWRLPPCIGQDLGTREVPNSWVGMWWKWWKCMQPEERAASADEVLSRPDTADWSGLAGMYGDNGLLQVMATLEWWGGAVAKGLPAVQDEWLAAVSDVTWVLGELLESEAVGQ